MSTRRLDWQNEVVSHLVAAFCYLFLVSLFRWRLDGSVLAWWLGGLAGTFLLDVDHLLYWFWTHPEKADSQKAKSLWQDRAAGARGVKAAWRGWYCLLSEVHVSHDRLTFHTATFQLVLLVLAFFILTSTGSVFGAGLIMAVNLHLLKDEWWDYFRRGQAVVANWLFWQVHEARLTGYLTGYLLAVSLLFLGLTRFLV